MPLCLPAQIPDIERVESFRHAPHRGPRILFFTGGSALRRLSRTLKNYTHNSIHLVTPFDSGGSSAKLRNSFGMLSVGDLRNRLMALADEGALGNPEIFALFSHRLEEHATIADLKAQLDRMITGDHPLVAAVPEPMRRIVQVHLRRFASHMPNDFDLRAASVGNLILAGGYLDSDRDIESVIFLFSKLVNVRGVVRPTVEADLHLAAELASGSVAVGQHRLTGKETEPIGEAINQLQLSKSLTSLQPASTAIDSKTRELIRGAELICYPMGSFYTSVVANLLPEGVGSAIGQRRCPKIYIPNLTGDPELLGSSVVHEVDTLLDYVRRDAGEDTPTEAILNMVLIDPDNTRYGRAVDADALRARGITVLVHPIAAETKHLHNAEAVSQILLSLA